MEDQVITDPTGFKPYGKTPRLNRNCVITEKLDGTNAQILITPHAPGPISSEVLAINNEFEIRAGSRNRWLAEEPKTLDNYGFARWVKENASELFKLGAGRHYGEWWGQGIARAYIKCEKTFSLFNTGRWYKHLHPVVEYQIAGAEKCPECCNVVPILYYGKFDTEIVNTLVAFLKTGGSFASPGFMNPEGIIVYHEASKQNFKVTIKDDDCRKSQV